MSISAGINRLKLSAVVSLLDCALKLRAVVERPCDPDVSTCQTICQLGNVPPPGIDPYVPGKHAIGKQVLIVILMFPVARAVVNAAVFKFGDVIADHGYSFAVQLGTAVKQLRHGEIAWLSLRGASTESQKDEGYNAVAHGFMHLTRIRRKSFV
jgi:hypothetical protein